MDGTEGLVRGQNVSDTGAPITIPVGPETLGRIMNVIGAYIIPTRDHLFFTCVTSVNWLQKFCSCILGEPIDERGPINTDKYAPIHAEAPEFVEMSVEQEILVTGIKVVDLLAPYAKGGKIGKIYSDANLIILREWYSPVLTIVVCRFVRWCWCRKNCIDYGTY